MIPKLDFYKVRPYTRFEKARIIGARALQISMGAPVLVEVPKGMTNPIDIALYEFEQGACPITILRQKVEEE
ncbi:MAG: DNA-directed RNA polymerase subunit K [Candidatus Hadarchaeales archaeon]